MYVQLAEYGFHVKLDRTVGYVEVACNDLVALTLRKVAQDFKLTRSQLLKRGGRLLRIIRTLFDKVGEQRGQTRINDRLAFHNVT